MKVRSKSLEKDVNKEKCIIMESKTFDYDSLAEIYDDLYKNKNYDAETRFLEKLLKKYGVKKVLDVGCGTGNHIVRLEKMGFECVGIDKSKNMLEIARKKFSGLLFHGDMRDFSIPLKFDAIICMFGVFNYNLSDKDALKTLRCFKKHLKPKGIVLLDLHNPINKGKKKIKVGQIEAFMEWGIIGKFEKTKAVFKIGNKEIINENLFRIYKPKDIQTLLEKAGFSEIKMYENYSFKKASENSKNILVIGVNSD